MGFRAFVAVPTPPGTALADLLAELSRLEADLKPVAPERLHITLSFLGDVEDAALPALVDALAETARGARRFTLDLQSVGAFPNARHPRVVWAGIADPRPISELAVALRAALAARGFPGDDKDFRAHVTLARVRSEQGAGALVSFLKRHGGDALGSIPVDEIILYESKQAPREPNAAGRSPHGPTYTALARAPLEA